MVIVIPFRIQIVVIFAETTKELDLKPAMTEIKRMVEDALQIVKVNFQVIIVLEEHQALMMFVLQIAQMAFKCLSLNLAMITIQIQMTDVILVLS